MNGKIKNLKQDKRYFTRRNNSNNNGEARRMQVRKEYAEWAKAHGLTEEDIDMMFA